MNRSSDSEGLGHGVFYERDAYADLLKRFAIIAIDLGVIIAVGAALFVFFIVLVENDDDAYVAFLWSWFLVIYAYLVFAEASNIGTLGFLVTGMKIVNLKGERPSFVRMTFRLLLWALGPFHPIIDLLFLSDDPNRQTLRDKLAGTYVVKKEAVPCGEGKVRLAQFFVLGFNILVPEVHRPRTPVSPPDGGAADGG
jgi:uncharacterized RDD family membrane protein YckC